MLILQHFGQPLVKGCDKESMSKIIAIAFASLACLFSGILLSFAYDAWNGNTSARDEIMSVVDRYHAALVDGDEETLGLILADKVKLSFNSKESDLNRDALLEKLQSLPGQLKTIDIHTARVELNGPIATVSCLVSMEMLSNSSTLLDHHGFYNYQFEKINGGWKITSIQLQVE